MLTLRVLHIRSWSTQWLALSLFCFSCRASAVSVARGAAPMKACKVIGLP